MADFIEGALAGQQFQMNQLLQQDTKVKLQEDQLKLQEMPIKLEQEKLALKIATADYQKRDQMAKMLAGMKVPEGKDPLTNAMNSLLNMGTAAAASGLPEEAATDFSHAATIAYQQAQAAHEQLIDTLQKTEFADSILANVKDKDTWKQANAFIKMQTGKESAVAHEPYSPELVKALRESTIKKRTDAEETYDRARAANEYADAEMRKQQAALYAAQKDRVDQLTTILKKNGGKPPTDKELQTDAARHLVEMSGDVTSITDAMDQTLSVVPDIQERMRQGFTKAQAVYQAVNAAQRAGKIPSPRESRPAAGSLPTNPLSLPTVMVKENPSNMFSSRVSAVNPDPAAYKDEQWYNIPDKDSDGNVRYVPKMWDAETQTFYAADELEPK
jgi:uncharacterized protein YcgL (UPF0745 family)